MPYVKLMPRRALNFIYYIRVYFNLHYMRVYLLIVYNRASLKGGFVMDSYEIIRMIKISGYTLMAGSFGLAFVFLCMAVTQ